MKKDQKAYQEKEINNNRKKKEDKEVNEWKLSMKEILKGACLINGDGP